MFYLRLLCLTPCRSDCALKDGTVHWIPRITFSFITWQDVDVKRVQFPVRLCFALPVHRSQGQTLKSVVFCLRRDVFMHGCLYLGLSTVRKSADIRNKLYAQAVNIVYSSLTPELLG